jgi:inorganic phosphate transporter, PiT family
MHFFQNLNFGAVAWFELPATIWLLILLALTFDFLNGLHDAANSVATVVSTRVLTPRAAVIWAAFFNFVAFVVFPLKVATTIQSDIVDPAAVQQIVRPLVAATLVAACSWNLLTWYWGLPTSSSHALIGGMVGAALMATNFNFGVLRWGGLGWIILFLFAAPIIGGLLGTIIATAVSWTFRKSTPRLVDTIFRRGQFVSAAFFSLGHGGNDAQKTMGIIFVLLLGAGYLKAPEAPNAAALTATRVAGAAAHATPVGMPVPAVVVLAPHLHQTDVKPKPPRVPTEVVLACHLAMGLGTMFGGWRIVRTMGQRIIRLRPVDGFCAETAAAITLAATTSIKGIPISTTHTITGAIAGVGFLRRLSAVRWGVAGRVVLAWFFTIPGAALFAALAWWLLQLFHSVSVPAAGN